MPGSKYNIDRSVNLTTKYYQMIIPELQTSRIRLVKVKKMIPTTFTILISSIMLQNTIVEVT